MGFTSTSRASLLLCLLQFVSLLRAVSSSGASCDTVFRGFSDCLLGFGENMVSYREDLDDSENLQVVCSFWNEFLSCTSAAVADCQDEAVELWEKLKVPPGSLNHGGSLFQLCSKDSAAPGLGFTLELIVWAMILSKLAMWVVF